MMDVDIQAIHMGGRHLACVEALRTEFGRPEGVDVSTDDDLINRDVRMRCGDGTVLHGSYDKHAGMFAVFVAESPRDDVGSWCGAVEASDGTSVE